jgi:hypothetical protein
MSLAIVSLLSATLLALFGVLVGQRVARSSAVEVDRWRKREETMRLLRWATELAVEDDVWRQSVGVEVVRAPRRAPILDPDDVPVVAAVLDAVARRSLVEEERARSPWSSSDPARSGRSPWARPATPRSSTTRWASRPRTGCSPSSRKASAATRQASRPPSDKPVEHAR